MNAMKPGAVPRAVTTYVSGASTAYASADLGHHVVRTACAMLTVHVFGAVEVKHRAVLLAVIPLRIGVSLVDVWVSVVAVVRCAVVGVAMIASRSAWDHSASVGPAPRVMPMGTCNEQHVCVTQCGEGFTQCGRACCSDVRETCYEDRECISRCEHNHVPCGDICCQTWQYCDFPDCRNSEDGHDMCGTKRCDWKEFCDQGDVCRCRPFDTTSCGADCCWNHLEECIDGECIAYERYDYRNPDRRYIGQQSIAIGADGVVVLPLTGWGDSSRAEYGGLGKLSYISWNQGRLTVRSGYIGHSGTAIADDLKLSTAEIPVLVGLHPILGSGFYIGVELGPVINKTKRVGTANGQDIDESDTRVRAGGTIGIGFINVLGVFDIGACVYSPNTYWPDEPVAIGAMLNLGLSGIELYRERR
ncbi:MAG: hypothetical protein FWD57_12805 [Polyangiaceae bacterium]|nr:hypothetical protein [Polyangiaceae bacterium]